MSGLLTLAWPSSVLAFGGNNQGMNISENLCLSVSLPLSPPSSLGAHLPLCHYAFNK